MLENNLVGRFEQNLKKSPVQNQTTVFAFYPIIRICIFLHVIEGSGLTSDQVLHWEMKVKECRIEMRPQTLQSEVFCNALYGTF